MQQMAVRQRQPCARRCVLPGVHAMCLLVTIVYSRAPGLPRWLLSCSCIHAVTATKVRLEDIAAHRFVGTPIHSHGCT